MKTEISPKLRDDLFRYCFLFGSLALIVLATVGITCYYTFEVFPETAYQLYPAATIACSVLVGFLALLTFLPSLMVFTNKTIGPFKRGVWGVVMTAIAILGVILYIVPLLLSSGN